MNARRRLVRLREYQELTAVCYAIEGTTRHVLELLLFGPAYSSRFLLLRSLAVLTDPEAASRIGVTPSRFGKALEFGRDLERDPESGDVFFTGRLPDRDLVSDKS